MTEMSTEVTQSYSVCPQLDLYSTKFAFHKMLENFANFNIPLETTYWMTITEKTIIVYFSFQQVAQTVGLPPKPVPDADWEDVTFGEISDELALKIKVIILCSITLSSLAAFVL